MEIPPLISFHALLAMGVKQIQSRKDGSNNLNSGYFIMFI